MPKRTPDNCKYINVSGRAGGRKDYDGQRCN